MSRFEYTEQHRIFLLEQCNNHQVQRQILEKRNTRSEAFRPVYEEFKKLFPNYTSKAGVLLDYWVHLLTEVMNKEQGLPLNRAQSTTKQRRLVFYDREMGDPDFPGVEMCPCTPLPPVPSLDLTGCGAAIEKKQRRYNPHNDDLPESLYDFDVSPVTLEFERDPLDVLCKQDVRQGPCKRKRGTVTIREGVQVKHPITIKPMVHMVF